METRYSYALAARDEAQLHAEVAALALPGFLGLVGSGGAVQAVFSGALTEAQVDDLDAVLDAHAPNANGPRDRRRLAAQALAQAQAEAAQVDRAIALLVMDEINLLRARLRAQDAAVAAASSLADLKTRWAALSAVPDRRADQIKPALLARIGTAEADPD